ncbi:MAG: protein-L-isoaspartate(D-aspartate) O-methyltransferase [Dethiobacteria bacterium]
MIHVDRQAFIKYFKSLDRALFLDKPFKKMADFDIPLPIGYGQTISQTSLVTQMIMELDPEPGSRVLEIGTGSGYLTALLAPFCKWIYTIERIPKLLETAQKRLEDLGYQNITYRLGNGYNGWAEEAPFDRIIAAAAALEVPPTLLEQLEPDGRMIIPIGPPKIQDLLLITKDHSGNIKQDAICKVVFVQFANKP